MKDELDPACHDATAAAIRDAFQQWGVPIGEAEVAPLVRALQRLQPAADEASQGARSAALDPAQAAAEFAIALRQQA
jgi:hypothetical protein